MTGCCSTCKKHVLLIRVAPQTHRLKWVLLSWRFGIEFFAPVPSIVGVSSTPTVPTLALVLKAPCLFQVSPSPFLHDEIELLLHRRGINPAYTKQTCYPMPSLRKGAARQLIWAVYNPLGEMGWPASEATGTIHERIDRD